MFHFAEDNKLCDLLVFATGLDAIPPLGIEPSPTLGVRPPGRRRGRQLARCAIGQHVSELPTHSDTRRLRAVQSDDVAGIGGRLDLQKCVRSRDLTSELNSTFLTCMLQAVRRELAISLSPVVVHVHSHGETCVVYGTATKMYSNASLGTVIWNQRSRSTLHLCDILRTAIKSRCSADMLTLRI